MADNPRLLEIAKEMATLIRRWRAEMSSAKNLGVAIDEPRLADVLGRVEAGGLPVTLVVYGVLYCEWSFRVRRATNEDIESALNDIERRLCVPPRGPLTTSQAHMLVNAVEPSLRKQMQGARVPIVYGFSAETVVFSTDDATTRRAHTPVVPTRRGSLPVLGPIFAGLVTEALFAPHGDGARSNVGADLCAILLSRKIVPLEYAKWRKTAGAFKLWKHRKAGLTTWLAQFIQRRHRQLVAQEGFTAEQLLQQCAGAPEELLGRSLAPELIQKIYSVPWNERPLRTAA
jgi:hypothetical protein